MARTRMLGLISCGHHRLRNRWRRLL